MRYVEYIQNVLLPFCVVQVTNYVYGWKEMTNLKGHS